MLNQVISLVSIASLSPLGSEPEQVWKAYRSPEHRLHPLKGSGFSGDYAGKLPEQETRLIHALKEAHSAYRDLDPSVLYAIVAARKAIKAAGWISESGFGVNIGSSRGATGLFEQYHNTFIKTGSVRPQTSPSTTLGNISSWVAQDLRTFGPALSHSITCSTAFHALLNGIAWIQSGLADRFLVGGSEAPLTAFTLAQMKALKIYSREGGAYPCRAMDLNKKNNTMVLGEGAAMACLEAGRHKEALAYITGMGYATEALKHGASMSPRGDCLERSMQMALRDISPDEIDAVVMHCPGTLKGDRAEYAAIKSVFGSRLPALTTNKWKLGHTLGTSGMLSLELAVQMLLHQKFIGVPYLDGIPYEGRLKNILINAVGFGGNAVSICIQSADAA
ncbi:beta-ketoacyl synthase N-terminal-like domain-containing protein [Robiginitalea aurantiaca]|uniref:Beta-ketoacyl synthase N-terminal-like domain-containing protein n=1 Tax=Robiginitalea aurantiaca TaxID=3056915 RepID=A0ABT7WEH4_9FLAO|nr:beta-ketoacyl synthase N-terminal-like domain-containing protein [Robiginitalea aurantiaca]MDM9631320.1 beta-ketoacyl synthase N-terminal-like domain-containing protein [Robiginitalea aurantiaca]